jgi:hypothetical protein
MALSLIIFQLFFAVVFCDWRDLTAGYIMVEAPYLDQPQCVVFNTTRWVCAITRNDGSAEGHPGEHMETMFSDDKGVTWSTGVRLEQPGTPTNSYGNILLTDFGRLAVVYNMNLDNITHFPNGTKFGRDDELGFMVWRYSDDGGVSWSSQQYRVPLRTTAVDRENTFGGSTQIFWSVDQIKTTRTGATLMAYTKIGTYMQNPPEQTFFVSSPNILSERNASAVVWNLFPEGDEGISPPGPPAGMNWEEAHAVQLLSQPGMFSVTRTSTGYLGAVATADDSGASGWGPAHFATFSSRNLSAAAGRVVKNPEGPITLKRFSNGKYLLLFYFNSVRGYFNASAEGGRSPRNPYWLAAGWEETDGEVRMSQPEVVLYNPSDKFQTGTGPGYPDFIEDVSGGDIYVTETNKTQARVHRLDRSFLALLFAQDTLVGASGAGLALRYSAGSAKQMFATPRLPSFLNSSAGAGATLGFWLSAHARAAPGATLVDTALPDTGSPLRVGVAADASAALELTLVDAASGARVALRTDAACTARLLAGGDAAPHLAAAVIDAAARVLTWSVDGVVCDGAADAFWGFEWAPDAMGDLQAGAHAAAFALAPDYAPARIAGGFWFTRSLMHSELVGAARAGPSWP